MATYDLSLQDTKGGYVAGDSVNLPLLTAWLVSGGITVTSLAVDAADPSLIHVDASAEPDLQDSWPLYWNNTLWQIGDPLPTPPAIEDDFVPNATPDTETYTLDLALTTLGWTAGNNIRVDQISQYLTDKGNPAQSVTPVVDGTGAQTGEIQVVRLASGSNISTGNWAAFNGPASVTIFGQNSVGEQPAGPVVTQSVEQGTHFGDGAIAAGDHSAAFGKDAYAALLSGTAVGDTAKATGLGASALGQGALASGQGAVAVGAGSTASGNSSFAAMILSLASGVDAIAIGDATKAQADKSTGVGAGAVIPSTSPRSSAYGAGATVPASTPDVGIWRNNSLELVPSRTGGTNDPTVLKLHASDGTVHSIGFNVGTGILTVDGLPVLTSIGTGYITSTMILDGTIALADLSAAVIANFATASALTTETTNRANADTGEITNRNAAIATHAALTATHGVTGPLVGTSDTQALSNKDLTSGTNTFPTLNQSTTGNAGTATKLATARTIDGQSFDGTANVTVIAPGTHAATSKTTPVDADELPIVDSAASNVLKKLTWANLKATVKTYTDTLYAAIVHTHAESDVTNLTTDLAAKAPLASPTFTGTVVLPSGQTIVTPTIASFANAAHDHSNAAGGGNIPEASVTNLVADLAAKATTTALTTETTNRTNADALLVPKTAIPSGQYYSNSNNGCYGKIATLACVANTGYFTPIELDYSSGSLTNISFSVTAMGTALNAKWAIYARSASGNATGNVLASGTIALTGVGLQVGTISPTIAMGAGLPNEYNCAIVFDGTVTLTALDVSNGGRNMYRSGNLLTNVTAGRTTAVTYSTGFVNSPTYTYTDQQIVPLAGLKAA